MLHRVTCVPFGPSAEAIEMKVVVTAQTPSELQDCELWRRKHRLHRRAIPIKHWPYGEAAAPREIERDLDELAQEHAIEVMLLWDRPFSWNTFEQGENSYGFRVTLEPTSIVKALVERLEDAEHIDDITLGIEQILLEREHQCLNSAVRSRRATRC